MGLGRALIDNVDKGTVCLFSPNFQFKGGKLFDGLPNGTHTISIRATGQKCGGGSDTNGSVDAFVTLQGTTENTSPAITWGSWKLRADGKARGGTDHYSKSVNASAKIRFHGTVIRVLTLKGPGFGQMRVIIDGATVDTVNLNDATLKPATFIYSNLSDGDHEIMVQNAGNKPAKGIPVDGFRGSPILPPTLDGN